MSRLTVAMIRRAEAVHKGELCPYCESMLNKMLGCFTCGSAYVRKNNRLKLVATMLCLSRIKNLRPIDA